MHVLSIRPTSQPLEIALHRLSRFLCVNASRLVYGWTTENLCAMAINLSEMPFLSFFMYSSPVLFALSRQFRL
jgi:hypothetical protein